MDFADALHVTPSREAAPFATFDKRPANQLVVIALAAEPFEQAAPRGCHPRDWRAAALEDSFHNEASAAEDALGGAMRRPDGEASLRNESQVGEGVDHLRSLKGPVATARGHLFQNPGIGQAADSHIGRLTATSD